MPGGRTVAYWPIAIPLGLIVVHVLFKQVFAIDSMVDFRTLGLAERTSWQALLLAAAWGLARGSGKLEGSTRAASALALAALLHFIGKGVHERFLAHQKLKRPVHLIERNGRHAQPFEASCERIGDGFGRITPRKRHVFGG